MPAPLVDIQSLSVRYPGAPSKAPFALDNVSLSIFPGEICGIIGQSGAGKSTLVRCLASLLQPEMGRILYRGEEIIGLSGEKLRAYRRQIGMVFQHFNLLSSRTVSQNVAYPLEIAELPQDRVDDLLRLVGLYHKRDAYPAELSGGEKQRVGIARALAAQPDLLLCDEATSALDPTTTREILALLKEINRSMGVTIILITHEMDVVRQICHRVAVLEHGRIIEMGSTLETFAHPQHAVTRAFLQHTSHELPIEVTERSSPGCKLLELRFTGHAAEAPIISEIITRYHVSANILMGWIDRVQSSMVGMLTIELTGTPENVSDALCYLQQQGISCREIHHHGQ
ncbi:MAG: methionine ABC transporter ATP-binding protein [Chlamydiia bacterium]